MSILITKIIAVAAGTAMAYLSYNMRRAISLAGIANLIAHFQGVSMQKCGKWTEV